MQTKIKTAIPFTLAAGTLALALSGCGTMMGQNDRSPDRSGDRMSDNSAVRYGNRSVVDRAAYTGVPESMNTPASVNAFSPGYVPFPASANESAGITGHSFYCTQHYSQPGCQTFDSASNDRNMMRNDRRPGRMDDRRMDDRQPMRNDTPNSPTR